MYINYLQTQTFPDGSTHRDLHKYMSIPDKQCNKKYVGS